MRSRKEAGFTLIELVVVLLILGLLLTLSASSIRAAIQHAKLVRSEKAIRDAGERWCALFEGDYPPTDHLDPNPKTNVPTSDFPRILAPAEIDQLATLLGIDLERTDAWGNTIEYRVDSWPVPTRLMIRSQNADHQWSEPPGGYLHRTFFPASDRVSDVVWVNCHWTQFYC